MSLNELIKINARAIISFSIGTIIFLVGLAFILTGKLANIVLGVVICFIGLIFLVHSIWYHGFRSKPMVEDHSFSKVSHAYETRYREEREPLEGNLEA